MSFNIISEAALHKLCFQLRLILGIRLEVLENSTVQMSSCTNGKLMFKNSFLFQFQLLCGAMADLALTRLLGYSCLLLVGVLQAQSSKRR